MKNLFTVLAVFALTLLAVSTSFAQATASATASATIVAPIGISKTVDMNFGRAAVSASLGTVILATDGGRTKSGGVTLTSGGTFTKGTSTIVMNGKGTAVIQPIAW